MLILKLSNNILSKIYKFSICNKSVKYRSMLLSEPKPSPSLYHKYTHTQLLLQIYVFQQDIINIINFAEISRKNSEKLKSILSVKIETLRCIHMNLNMVILS